MRVGVDRGHLRSRLIVPGQGTDYTVSGVPGFQPFEGCCNYSQAYYDRFAGA